MSDYSQQKQFTQLRKVIYQRLDQHLLSQEDLILRQTELLEQCRSKLQRRKAFDTLNNFSLSITNISSINNISNTDDSFRNRFTEQFQNSILNAAVKQIKINCTEETFDTVMNYIVNSKAREYEELKKDYDRKYKECEELSVLIIIKQKDISFLEKDLANLRVKEEFLEEERRKVRKKACILDEKEKRLHRAQMSLIFKEKLNLEGKRRYQRQKDSNDETALKLQKIYCSLGQIWNKIVESMQTTTSSCPNNCWKQDIMRKCKQQLLEQRKILQQQQKQIEHQYQTLRNLSQQIKKVFVNVLPDNINKKNQDPPVK